ncbi:MAG: type II secretion system protein [Microcoleaceae cyanobacterium]
MKKASKISRDRGFTFTEIISTIVVMGILIAIISPSWLGFIARQQLRTSINKIYWTMQNARDQAQAKRSSWQASFRQNPETNQLQYAVHSTKIKPAELSESLWQNLADGVEIDTNQTSLLKVDPTTNQVKRSETGYYRTIFNYKGCPVYWATDECTQTSLKVKGRITLKHPHLGEYRRCVIVSTVIGALRIAEDASKPIPISRGKNCYRRD